MIGEKDLAGDGESSRTKPSKPRFSQLNGDNADEKIGLFKKGIDFLSVRSNHLDGFSSRSTRSGNELTLSYLCDNRDLSGKIAESLGQKGKEVAVSENSNHDEKWVERDFLNLGEMGPKSSKRKVQEEEEEEVGDEKKSKVEALNLSLALPDVSLSLTASNGVKKTKPTTSERTATTFSNDFTAAPSMSYSYSHPFSHNPSCSLTRNSTDFDCSIGRDDQIWCAGEGTNGSVHSRFRPIGDSVALANNPSFCKPTSSDYSFFPSELAARSRVEVTHSGDSRKKDSEKLPNSEGHDAGRSERVLYGIVSESISSVALMIQGMTDETLESAKEHLRDLIDSPEKKEKLTSLQNQLEKRCDLSKETLSKCVKDQLDILVAVRTGLKYFLSGKIRIPMNELVEIFLFMRCRNVNCKSLLPVDDCECKICSNNKGFCSSCMCPVCLKFDSASNTCSWVGCDVCSHWCHAACGIQKNLIKPGLSLKGPRGTTEMLFHCVGCGHVSEMFGFVKDVFMCCAENWGQETLVKELDCVRKIFRSSNDIKGKELYRKADEMVTKLESKRISPSEACKFVIQFFNHAESIAASNEAERSYRKDEASVYAAKEEEKRTDGDVTGSGFDSLESMVRIKEVESIMFGKKAEEARREAESLKRMIEMKTEKMEDEYTEKLSRLCLQETEERRRRKLEELKALEISHCDYKNMKLRMEADIAALLKRMEITRQQWPSHF